MEESSIPDKFRRCRWQMLFQIDVLKNFSIFTGKHLCLRLILTKRDSNIGVFLEYLRNFKNIFFTEHFCWLFPQIEIQKKSTTVNREGLKIRTERLNMKNTQISHFTFQPFQTVFTCPNAIIKTEKHCTKHVQRETKNKF